MDLSFSDLNYNSIETFPGFEARAAFTVNSVTLFTPCGCGCFAVREDVDIVPAIVDDKLSYVRLWKRIYITFRLYAA